MYIAIVCKPSCDVMIFEVDLIFLIKPVFLHDQRYGCSFVARLNFFFWENICFLQNDTTFAEKIVFIWKKNFILKFFFYWKKRFLHFSNENIKINISFGKHIFIQKMFVLQIKYKSFLNIYSFCKKKKKIWS